MGAETHRNFSYILQNASKCDCLFGPRKLIWQFFFQQGRQVAGSIATSYGGGGKFKV